MSSVLRPTLAPSPPVRTAVLVAVFLVSGAMLAYQVLQVVVLGLQLFPEAAFLVVSLSMLGLGCGGSLATVLTRRLTPADLVGPLLWSAVAFPAAMLGSMILTSRLHALLPLILVSAVPYVFAGLFLSLLFALWRERATEIYFADLLGAGVGCAAIVGLLDGLADAGTVTIALAVAAALGAMLVSAAIAPRRLVFAGIVLVATVAAFGVDGRLFVFGPGAEKFYGQLLAKGERGGRVARDAWNFLGRVDAFDAGPAIGDFAFARKALDLMDAGSAFRLLFINGYNWTYSVDFRGHADQARQVFDRWVQRVPYLFTNAPDVLNLGSGGGADVYLAMQNAAHSATAVDINGLMIEAATEWYRNDWDRLWQRPNVSVHEIDARTFVNTTGRRFDVVTLNAVDTAATQSSLLSTNFLYTTEAFTRYIDVLRPGGVIFLTRPRAQLLRAVTAAVAALGERGVTDVGRHIVVLADGELLSAAIYVDPLTAAQATRFAELVKAGELDATLQYAPGLELGSNLASDYFTALGAGRLSDFEQRHRVRTDPATDDEPYFYQVEPSFIGSIASQVLALLLFLLLGIGIVLILVPLLRLKLPDKNRLLAGHFIYFGCLGLGFMLVEIAVMQQLSLVLGHPAYSVSVTLAGMLIACGLGSLAAGVAVQQWRAHTGAATVRTAALVASAIAIALYAVVVPLVEQVAPASLIGRVVLCLGLLAPGSFFMGMPFPLKVQSLEGADSMLVPWAWVVNGLASVAGSVLAIGLTMMLGFRGALLIAAALYVVALAADRMTRTAPAAVAQAF
jgi:SAM-dependent methyltransferase